MQRFASCFEATVNHYGITLITRNFLDMWLEKWRSSMYVIQISFVLQFHKFPFVKYQHQHINIILFPFKEKERLNQSSILE